MGFYNIYRIMGHLINEISRIKGIMGIISEGESQFDSSEKKTIDDFVDFVKKELNIDNDVEVKLQNDKDGIKTTAVYSTKTVKMKNLKTTASIADLMTSSLLERLYRSNGACIEVLRNQNGKTLYRSCALGYARYSTDILEAEKYIEDFNVQSRDGA